MHFTGERFIPTEQGRIRLEHYHRYAIVLDVVKEKDVLDVACGEGYGSSFMADVARSVDGVDISDEAVQHASTVYKKPNLTFHQGSAIGLDFADASFDVVVSFETIEHLAEQAQMLAEIRRVLRPDGVLVISSPNRPIYSEESGEHNEFHVKELDFKEFDELLRTQFQTIQYFGQRILMGSVIQPLDGGQSSFRAWHDDGNDLKQNAGHLADPVYFLAVCGTSNIGLPSIDMSVLYPDKLDLVKQYVGFAKWAQTLDRIVAERDGQIARLNQVMAERDGQISSLNQTIAERERRNNDQLAVMVSKLAQETSERAEDIVGLNQAVVERDGQIANLNLIVAERDRQVSSLNQTIAERERRNTDQLAIMVSKLAQETTERAEDIVGLNQAVVERDGQIANLTDETVRSGEWALRLDTELKEVRARLNTIIESNSWRLTLPLREMRRWIYSPRQQINRYTSDALHQAKRIYQSLPLSYQTKAAHRNALAKYFPKLLLVSGSHSATIPKLALPIMKQATPELFATSTDFAKNHRDTCFAKAAGLRRYSYLRQD